MDLSARSSLSQQFGRALKHDLQLDGMYKDLDEKLKLEFRRTWAM